MKATSLPSSVLRTGAALVFSIAVASSPAVARGEVCANPYGPADMAPVADINASGTINISDAMCVVLATLWSADPAGSPAPVCIAGDILRADLNCSGSINVSDIVSLIHVALYNNLGILDLNADTCPDNCAVCSGSLPQSCIAGSDCFGAGESHPEDACRVCVSGATNGAWAGRPEESPCGTNMACYGGLCEARVPGAPTNVAASLIDVGFSVAFLPPAFHGSAPIIRYTATCTSTTGGATVEAMGAENPLVTPTPTYGHTYLCSVHATNAVGDGPESAPAEAIAFIPVLSSCMDHHVAYESGDGVYWIDPDGVGDVTPFEVYCDMTTDGGGWTLYVVGAWLYAGEKDAVLDPLDEVQDSMTLRSDRLEAILAHSQHIFRMTDPEVTRAFYIYDPAPLAASAEGEGGYAHGHMWAAAAGNWVECATTYDDVVNDAMTRVTTQEVNCDAEVVGNHVCGTGSGWILFHTDGPYDLDGSHPCSMGPGQVEGLTLRWVR